MKLLNLRPARRKEAETPERNERTQKVQYAPQVWSDVYKKSTQGKKLPADGGLCGRSMVEMLGVLAIIGVLSVGAIAGYQKAMTKYKLNKFTTQISDLLNVSIATADKFSPPTPESGKYTYYNLIPYYLKLNNVPQEMIHPNITAYLYTSFGSRVTVSYINWGFRNYIETVIVLERGYKEQCIAAFNVINALKDDIYRVNIHKVTEPSPDQELQEFKYVLEGNDTCGKYSYTCLKELDLNDYEMICRECEDDHKSCTLRISYALQGTP